MGHGCVGFEALGLRLIRPGRVDSAVLLQLVVRDRLILVGHVGTESVP